MQQGILNVSLDDVIGNTVVASWRELVADGASSRLHIEYHRTAPNEDVQYLKMWAADGKGGWKPVCRWLAALPDRLARRLTFSKPFYSSNFAQLLTAVLENQNAFSEEQARDGSIQISPPTEDDRAAALTRVQTALTDRQLCEVEPLN